jgi:hypothetical protein
MQNIFVVINSVSDPGHEEERNACGVMIGKPEGVRILGRPRHSREKNIEMDFKEIGW